MEYLQNVDHCEPSPYVKKVTITALSPAEGLDNLVVARFKEIGRFALVRKNTHKVGDTVIFIPAESVLPLELSEKLGVTKYTAKGRVKVNNLKGNRSEGLAVKIEIAEPYIPFILKWEDPPSKRMAQGGSPMAIQDIPPEFNRFYKMPNLLDEPETFERGENLVWSIKFHGTNCRFGYLPHPHTGEYLLYVGSMNTVLKETENNLYWLVVKQTLNRTSDECPNGLINNIDRIKDVILYGEIYGPGIQKGYHYDLKNPTLRLFASKIGYEYQHYLFLQLMCNTFDFPVVKFNPIKFESVEQMRELANTVEGPTKSHVNEGIVITSMERPEKMAKIISFNYLLQKGRTERR